MDADAAILASLSPDALAAVTRTVLKQLQGLGKRPEPPQQNVDPNISPELDALPESPPSDPPSSLSTEDRLSAIEDAIRMLLGRTVCISPFISHYFTYISVLCYQG